MKKIILFIAALTAASLALGEENCDCPSCLAKKDGTFTLPGLEGLNASKEEAHAKEIPADPEGHEDHEAEHDSIPHDHDGDGVPDHDSHEEHDHAEATHEEEACCPHDEVYDEVPHDHDGDGVSEHESHDGHDHAEEARGDHSGCAHDHGAVDSHAGHDHGDGGVELSAEMMEKIGIEIHEAEAGTVSRFSVFPAEIKLNRNRTASVSPRYVSIVRQVFAEIGDTVKRGDILASLENRETMAVFSVSAPQDGVIISKDLAVGEIASEERVLYQISDLSSVWADISIFPQYQHLLKKGMKVSFIAHDGCGAVGQVKYISPIVSHETRTFTARCILDGARDDFTPGAFVRAKIKVASVDASVVVPVDAVQKIEGESVVFIPGDYGFITAPVRTGLADSGSVEIKSGLKPGDRFVAEGAFALKAQMVTSGMDPHAGHGH